MTYNIYTRESRHEVESACGLSFSFTLNWTLTCFWMGTLHQSAILKHLSRECEADCWNRTYLVPCIPSCRLLLKLLTQSAADRPLSTFDKLIYAKLSAAYVIGFECRDIKMIYQLPSKGAGWTTTLIARDINRCLDLRSHHKNINQRQSQLPLIMHNNRIS